MKVAIIGRTEILYDSTLVLKQNGHDISCILTAKEAPEYTRTSKDFQLLAKQWGIPFAQGPYISDHVQFLKDSKSDIAVSMNYTGLVPQEIIDIFPLGILNSHGGDLPRYRGNACQAWAILNGETRVGLCIHKMIGGELDSGDIIARDYMSINHNTKITTIWNWMAQQTPHLFVESLKKLSFDTNYILERQSKNPRDALRCYPRKPEDGRIDWNQSAIDILRLINASNKPYAGAYCEYKGEKLIIWEASLVEDEEIFLAVPGQITHHGHASVEVACGSGKIKLDLVEINNCVSVPAQFISSIRIRLL